MTGIIYGSSLNQIVTVLAQCRCWIYNRRVISAAATIELGRGLQSLKRQFRCRFDVCVVSQLISNRPSIMFYNCWTSLNLQNIISWVPIIFTKIICLVLLIACILALLPIIQSCLWLIIFITVFNSNLLDGDISANYKNNAHTKMRMTIEFSIKLS